MKLKTLIINFFKPSKKKVLMILVFPFIAVFTLFFDFFLDEILRWNGNWLFNSIYSLADYYLFVIIFLPIKIFDDFPLIPGVLLIILTIIWWYFLSCLLNLKNSIKNDK